MGVLQLETKPHYHYRPAVQWTGVQTGSAGTTAAEQVILRETQLSGRACRDHRIIRQKTAL